MDRFSRGLFIVTACLVVSISVVTGIRCYTCQYIKSESTNQAVQNALSGLSSMDECPKATEANSTTIEDCPMPQSGGKEMCAKVNVTAEATVSSISAKIDVVMRGCFEKPTDTEDGCNQPEDTDKTNLQRTFEGKATIVSVEGNVCRCSSDLCNGQQKVTAEKLCWLAGLLLAFNTRQLW